MMKRSVRFVDVAPGIRLWTELTDEKGLPPIVVVMGANASGLTWPDSLVDALAAQHQVVRYDHRDTGRSTRCFPDHPYPLTELADDVVRLLDSLGFEKAHLVGMSMGGTLTQLLLLDHPERVASATLLGVAPLEGAPMPEGVVLPGPTEELLALWSHFGDERSLDEDLAFWVEHWRVLNGKGIPFDESEFVALEHRVRAHEGEAGRSFAHAVASQDGLDRGGELCRVTTPTLVIDAPFDPTVPPPSAEVLAAAIPGAFRVTIPGMGHAMPSVVIAPLAAAILRHVAAASLHG